MVGNRRLKVADFHCDALSKLQANPGIDFKNDPRLDVTAERLTEEMSDCRFLPSICLRCAEGQSSRIFWGKSSASIKRLPVLEGCSG